MKWVFVCSPYRGNTEKNLEVARRVAEIAAICDYIPIVPHLLFPQFLDDNDPRERIKSLNLGVEMLSKCDSVWLVVGKLSRGMLYILEAAKKQKIPIRLIDQKANRINAATLCIDDRVDDSLREALKGATLE